VDFMAHFIAICDDEKDICAELESIVIDICDKLNIKYEIDIYFTGEALCQKISAGAHYDLIFLDIEFAKHKMNGIEVGRFIRDTHNNSIMSIVYISWHMKFAMQLFDMQPLNFLIKPLDDTKVENTIKAYLKISKFWSETFTYKIGHDIFKVKIKELVYLESLDRKVVLHFADGRKAEFYGALKEVYQDQLEKFNFLFIHAKYVVNYDYVTVLKYDELIIAERNATLPISQSKRKEIRNLYMMILESQRT